MRWVFARALLASMLHAFDAHAASFVPVGDIAGDGFLTHASAVSADGSTVVGFDRNNAEPDAAEGEPFLWTSNGIVGLGVLPGSVHTYATDVSGDGSVVVGLGWVGNDLHGFRWTSDEGMVDFGPGVLLGHISADGSTMVGGIGTEAVRWTSDEGVVGIGDLAGGDISSGASSASADGSVVVGIATTASAAEAFRWTSDGGMVGLGHLSCTPPLSSHANDVSADGSIVVGGSRIPFGYEAFRWTTDEGMVGLGFLPNDPNRESDASNISGDGSTIVGFVVTAGDRGNVFVWDAEHGMRGLQDVLKSLGLEAELEGWRLSNSTGVSANGKVIVGIGTDPSGQTRGWVADLSPPTACDDGLDDDGDGLLDLADPGCADSFDDSERDATLPCDDGLDNDGDGLVDFPADVGCRRSEARTEKPHCQDGRDNDADGAVDFDGGASAHGGMPIGPADSICVGQPGRGIEVENCGLGAELAGALVLLRRLKRRIGASP